MGAEAAGSANTVQLDAASPYSAREPGMLDRLVWSAATARSLSPKMRKAVRKRFGKSRPGPFDIMAEGIRFRAYPTENRCDRIIVGRGALPEPDEHVLLAPFVQEGMVFVDIGANIGTYALWAAGLVGPQGRVVALEPHPRTFAKLAFNCLANDVQNIETVNVAAGPEQENGAVLRFDGGGNIGNASLATEDQRDAGIGVAIQVKPLASVLNELGIRRTNVIKVDVEGFEDQALLPLFEATEAGLWPETIMIETVLRERWKRDCIAFLEERSYAAKTATAENVILRRQR